MNAREGQKDKYKAVWVSHSSIGNFLKCPRLYFLHDVYKDPSTGRKVSIINPHMSLGLAVHDVIESLSDLVVEERFTKPLSEKFEKVWEKYSGKKGGFKNKKEESEFKKRGLRMLKELEKEPGLLLNKAIKIKTNFIPNYWLSEEDNIILCGKIDWLEYLPESDSVHIVDFKTGKNYEDRASLQLPIYLLLVTNTQGRKVSKASYWYLESNASSDKKALAEKKLPDIKKAHDEVFKIASRIKLARSLGRFVCPHNGCKYCLPYEQILKGKGERVALSNTRQDVYIL